jgi:hypothetical protein
MPSRAQPLKPSISLITHLEDALKSGSSEKRVATLKRVTNLFLNEANHLNEQQVAVFDDVLIHLVERIESKVLSELSAILAPIPMLRLMWFGVLHIMMRLSSRVLS